MTIPVKNDWVPILKEAMATESYQRLHEFLKKEYETEKIYPPKENIWQAFEWTPYSEVKVVILGQDPYIRESQAHGLSFSVQKGVKLPPSLKNIYKELEADLGYSPVEHGYLESWAKEGVLLLNTVLTVREGLSHSHKRKGWEELTNFVIQQLNQRDETIVFILWGNPSIEKRPLIDESKHVVLTSSHPSPFSARKSFFGSRPFSKTNVALVKSGQAPINWELPQN